MNHEFELKLQSYLDGELPAREAKDFAARAQTDPAAQALLEELRCTRTALRGNEPEHKLPESPEFYWSKIERGILAEEKLPGHRSSPFSMGWMFRYWPQLGGASAAALLLLIAAFLLPSSPASEDIENPLTGTSTFTFRSEPDRMTLVWISEHTDDTEDEVEAVN